MTTPPAVAHQLKKNEQRYTTFYFLSIPIQPNCLQRQHTSEPFENIVLECKKCCAAKGRVDSHHEKYRHIRLRRILAQTKPTHQLSWI